MISTSIGSPREVEFGLCRQGTCVAINGYDLSGVGAGCADNHPVQMVSWYQDVKWANARSEKEGLTPCYTVTGAVYRTGESAPDCNWSTNGYRLPTEAEWEKAARGGVAGHRFPWSDTNTIQHTRANYIANTNLYAYDTSDTNGYHPSYTNGTSPYTSPVGIFSANGYGLYDMAGNVWEWCWDWWDDSYYESSPETNPQGPGSGSYRVMRGAAWFNTANLCRVADRDSSWPGLTYGSVGFRLLRTAQ